MVNGARVVALLVALASTASCGRIGFNNEAAEIDAGSEPIDASNLPLRPALARYWVNEAASGQGITELVDDTANPFPLPLTYAANTPVFDDEGVGGRHIRFRGDVDVGSLSPTRGSKFAPLHQATEVTLEIKVLVEDCDTETEQQRMFGFTDGSYDDDHWLGIRSWVPGGAAQRVGMILTWAGRDLWTFFYTERCPDTLNVLHWVVDTHQAQPEDRIRSYQDGVRIPVLFYGAMPGDSDWPPQGATINLPDLDTKPQQMYLGRALDGDPRANGLRIYYMAVYSEALTDTQISEHSDYLSVFDD